MEAFLHPAEAEITDINSPFEMFPFRSIVLTFRPEFLPRIRDGKATPKNLCEKDFAELSGELSGAICLKALVLLGSALELFGKFFGTVRAIFLLWGSLLAQNRKMAPQAR